MEGVEELVPLIGIGAEEVSLALLQLLLEGFNGSGQAPLLCNQGGNVMVHVMVLLELSCNSPVFLGPRVVGHGSVGGVIAEQLEEPVGKFPLFVYGDALGHEQLLPLDWLTNPSGAQAVQPIMFDVGGEDMYGVVTVSDWG